MSPKLENDTSAWDGFTTVTGGIVLPSILEWIRGQSIYKQVLLIAFTPACPKSPFTR